MSMYTVNGHEFNPSSIYSDQRDLFVLGIKILFLKKTS